MTKNLPVCRPKLPEAEKLLPYLKRIDTGRHYTNFGPLLHELESRLAETIAADRAHLATAASGMAALELILWTCDLPAGNTAILPAWTFCATAHAVMNAGLKPFFADVDPHSWALTPAIAEQALAIAPKPVSLALPVAPFGQPLPVKEWEDFSRKHKIQVVIDGATLCPEDIVPSAAVPVMISLHATKVLNAGEGGLIVWQNADRITEIKNCSGFGLLDPAGITARAANAKMSEYHAAVALAALDEYEHTKNDFLRIARRYRKNLHGADIQLLPGYGDPRYNSFCPVEYDALNLKSLSAAGIETKSWWRKGCHAEPYFAAAPRAPLPGTEHLAAHSTGLPCYRDLHDSDIDFICETVLGAI